MAFDPDVYLAKKAIKPNREVQNKDTGKNKDIKADAFDPDVYLQKKSIAMQAEAEKQNPIVQQPQAEPLPVGTDFGGILDAGISLAGAGASDVIGGWAGIGGALIPGREGQGASVAESVSSAISDFTQPRTQAGQQKLQSFAESPPIKALGSAKLALDNAGSDAGSFAEPLGAVVATATETIIKTLPDTIGTILGLKGASAGVDLTAKAAGATQKGLDNLVKTISGRPDIRVFDDNGLVTPEAMNIIKAAQAQGIDVDSVARKSFDPNDLQGLLTEESADVIRNINDPALVAKEGVDEPLTALGMIENYNTFKRRGIQPTRANITQNRDDWKVQQDALKADGDISKLVTNQDRMMAEWAREGKESIGYTIDTPDGVSGNIFETVNDIAETYDNAVTQAYSDARKVSPNDKNIKLDKFTNILRQNAGNNSITNGLIASIRQELKNKGVSKSGFTSEGKVDVRTAEAIRQHINSLHDSTSGYGKSVMWELKEALDDDVISIVGEDIFKEARMAKVDFHQLFNRGPVNKWEKSQKSFIKDILTGVVNQDQIVPKMQNLSPEQFADAKDFFLQRSGPAGIASWNNFKARVLQDALDDAQKSMSGSVEGKKIDYFDSKAFARKLKPLKERSAGKGQKGNRFEAIFNKDEQSLINDLIAIGDLRRPDPRVAQGSGPSGAAIQDLQDAILNGNSGLARRGAKALTSTIGNWRKGNKQKALESSFINPRVLTGKEEKAIGVAIRRGE